MQAFTWLKSSISSGRVNASMLGLSNSPRYFSHIQSETQRSPYFPHLTRFPFPPLRMAGMSEPRHPVHPRSSITSWFTCAHDGGCIKRYHYYMGYAWASIYNLPSSFSRKGTEFIHALPLWSSLDLMHSLLLSVKWFPVYSRSQGCETYYLYRHTPSILLLWAWEEWVTGPK